MQLSSKPKRCRVGGVDRDQARASSSAAGQAQPQLPLPPSLLEDDGNFDFEFESVTERKKLTKQFLGRLDAATGLALQGILAGSPGFTTAYSGCGCFESLLAQISSAMGVQPPPCWHACDIGSIPQRVLLAHTGPTAPRCVFGDLTLRVSDLARRKLLRIQQRLRAEFEEQVLTLGKQRLLSGCVIVAGRCSSSVCVCA